VPVLILPGWKDRARALRRIARGLEAHGWPPHTILPLEFHDPFGSNLEHAHEIRTAILGLRERTGAQFIDVVAHSMGGLALRYYLVKETLHDTASVPPVRRAVFLATPHRGTWTAWLAWGQGAREMRPGSEFLRDLSRTPLPDNVCACCVRTRIDSHVMPGESAVLPNTDLHVLSAVTHRGMLRDRTVLRLIVQHLQDVPLPT
jgi:triacylglycerol lipase